MGDINVQNKSKQILISVVRSGMAASDARRDATLETDGKVCLFIKIIHSSPFKIQVSLI